MQSLRRLRSALLVPALVLVVGLLASGCGAYPQNIFENKSDFAQDLDNLFSKILIAMAVVFFAVEGLLIWVVIRYRRRPGDRLPKQIHGHTTLEIIWTAAPAVVLAFVLVPTTETIFRTQAAPPPGTLQVNVIGHQFWWEFEYPELGVITANEVHMPVGQRITFNETSADVIHSFWVPALGGKRDVVPGRVNRLSWTPNATGTFPGQCAELCGYSHANMRLRAVVESQQDFDAWVAQQKAPAVTPTEPLAVQGAQVFQQRGCAGCHTIAGTQAQARVGPNLTHFGSRQTVAAGIMDNTPENLRTWLADPPGVKPGAAMPNLGLNAEELDALVAYLLALK